MGTIIIRDLEVSCSIGISETERATPQRVLVTIEMITDITAAAVKDNVRWSIDYDAVCRRIQGFCAERSCQLLETLAIEIADLVLGEFGPISVTVEVKKFALPRTAHVAVRVTRPL